MDLTFRRLDRADLPMLGAWLAAPHVARWWHHEHDAAALERDFGPSIDAAIPAEDHLALVDDRPVGLVQFVFLADWPDYVADLEPLVALDAGATSIDYLLGDVRDTGRGLGTAMLRAFTSRVWSEHRRATSIVVPVHRDNVASWRALRAAGYEIVATGDLEPDNPADSTAHVVLRAVRPHAVPPR